MSRQAARLSAALALVLAILAPAAHAAGLPLQRTEFSGFRCEIDLAENGLPGGVVATFNTRKFCTTVGAVRTIRIECRSKITPWTGGLVAKPKVPCRINTDQCGFAGASGNVSATPLSLLAISRKGDALLTCAFIVPRP